MPRKQDTVDPDDLASIIGTAARKAGQEPGADGYDVGNAIIDALARAGWQIVRQHPRLSPEARGTATGRDPGEVPT